MMARSGLTLNQGFELSGMSFGQLWLRCIAMGDAVSELELEAYVLGLLVPDHHQHDVIAQAINEHFIERGQNHPVQYRSARAAE